MVNFIGLSIVREIECYVITTTATKTIQNSPKKKQQTEKLRLNPMIFIFFRAFSVILLVWKAGFDKKQTGRLKTLFWIWLFSEGQNKKHIYQYPT